MRLYQSLVNVAKRVILTLNKIVSNTKLENIILFSSIPDYGDSSREVCELMVTMKEFENYKFIWFCSAPEKLRAKKSSNVIIKKRHANPVLRLTHLRCMSAAKYCVYTHELVGNIYNQRQVRIYIEHGSFGIKKGKGAAVASPLDHSTYRIFTRGTENEIIRVCGFPRNDRLFNDAEPIKQKLGLLSYSKLIIWMPTAKHFVKRSLFNEKINDYGEETAYDISLQEDKKFYNESNDILKKRNMLLVIKYHPSQDMNYVDTREFSNIRIIEDEELAVSDISLYSLLGASDALITDFSSVCYDYLLLNRPIGFDITDLDLYISGDNVAFDNPLDFMPGEKIKNTFDFCNFLEHVAAGTDNYEEERKKMLDFVHVHKDNQSAQRVVDLILSDMRAKELNNK